MNFLPQIDNSWTLFLDRDGVINLEKENDYIRSASELILYKGAAEAIAYCNLIFQITVVVTNQRGIGKGLMTEADLQSIHALLSEQLAYVGGNIDAYYFAPQLSNDAQDRKPNTGMGLQAQRDFPSIEFAKSVMIGNNISDMQFGKNLGMKTVYLNTTSPRTEAHPCIDWYSTDLADFAKTLQAFNK
jgi:D-glycero-D-manno-heptose 1,7-bisphosphate phosphatase